MSGGSFATRTRDAASTRLPTALSALLARRADQDGDSPAPGGPVYSTEALTMESGFAGVDGIFRLREDGLVERRYAVIEMQRNALEVLDPAPTDFRERAF
jgi:hypothetical protein